MANLKSGGWVKEKIYAKAGPVKVKFLNVDHAKRVFFRGQMVSIHSLY